MGSHEFSRNPKNVTDGVHDRWDGTEELFSMLGIESLGLVPGNNELCLVKRAFLMRKHF